MKKLLIISLLVSFMITTSVYSRQHESKILDEQEAYTEAEGSVDWEQMMRDQEGAVAANSVLMQYYSNGETEPVYPEYFAGRYIEDNILHICYVGELERVQEELEPIFGEFSSYVIYEKRNYSYHYLQEYLATALINYEAQGCQIMGYGIREKDNKVLINVSEDTYQNVVKMNNNSRQLMDGRIMIEKSAGNKFSTSAYAGGELTILNSGNTVYATLGICGTYNGRLAFLTCGHDMATGRTVYYDDTLMGVTQYVQCTHGEDGDFAIGYITNTSAIQATHKIKNGTVLTGGTMSAPAVGTIVSRYGAVTGLTYGTIVDTDMAFRFTEQLETVQLIPGGFCVVEPAEGEVTVEGDSGGPYWSNGKFLGTHTGINTTTGNWYFSPYSLAAEAGFTAYASHQLSSWASYNSVNHRAYCSICQVYIYEAHSSYLNSSGVCTRCGYGGASAID